MSTADTTHPTPAPSPVNALRLALADIKLAHTVFALPFALLGAVAALVDHGHFKPVEVATLILLVVLAMLFARTWAMLVNRLADRRFDASNPRTAKRALAAGTLSPRAGWTIALAAAALFIATAAGFWLALANAWPLLLAVPVLLWIALYSYTKRFTALAHFFLGGALAVSPLCAAIAVNPRMFGLLPHIGESRILYYYEGTANTPTLEPETRFWIYWMWTDSATALLCIAGFVALWVAGFDIAYALQDIEHDRELKLNSIPAKLGIKGSLWLSRACHALAVAALIAAAVIEPRFHAITACAVVVVAVLLAYEHAVLHKRGTAGLPLAFFTLNGIVSCLFGAAAITDLLV